MANRIGQTGIIKNNAASIRINNKKGAKACAKTKWVDIKARKPSEVGRVSNDEWVFEIIHRGEESEQP